MHLFGRAKSKATPQEAIVKMRETLLMLEKREAFLQTKADNEHKVARTNATKNKRVAIMALKRKKKYEQQIDQIQGAHFTLQTQVMAIESASVNQETMNAMKTGAQAIKNIHGAMNVDEVDRTMDDVREQMEVATEISNAIAQPFSLGEEFDEDELNAELEQLEQEELDEKLLGAEVPPQFLPAVPGYKQPISTVSAAEEDHEAELEKLRAEMAL